MTELSVIDNPSKRTYVGTPHKEAPAATLLLAVPKEFAGPITFDKEAIGRQFALIEQWPTTNIPWTPGQREIEYSYVLAQRAVAASLARPLDLPAPTFKSASARPRPAK